MPPTGTIAALKCNRLPLLLSVGLGGFASLVLSGCLGFLSGAVCGTCCGSMVLLTVLLLLVLGSVSQVGGPGSAVIGSSCRATPALALPSQAYMARAIGQVGFARLAVALTAGKACTDSRSMDNMLRERSFFLDYTPLTNRYIQCANGELMEVKGEGSYAALVNGRPCQMA